MYKYLVLLVLISILASAPLFTGDNEMYLKYAGRVKAFDTAGHFLTRGADGEVNIKNSAGNILRFRVTEKDELGSYHCGIVFIYFEFTDGWI